ncbi:GntR family transcriptional regulator [Limibacillus sp. MBR-115]|jgi:DNA-binding GntR family transcriptional regulator|uniref:GntR family transcriptional regulator n=1 Tax=Limibacillus sp. MBR-115 TaxID=3156465 RepID=UPI003394399B
MKEPAQSSRSVAARKSKASAQGQPESRRQIAMALRILGYIRQEGLKVDSHLVEQQLAQHFSVSRTPIRNALMLLESRGAVTSVPNLGFFVAKSVADLYEIELALPPSNAEQLYLRIVNDRISGRLPDSITQVEMLRLYDVNRALLGQVLSQMTDEGLVVRNPGQGWTFLPTLDSQQARRASYEFRRILEPEGILLPNFTIDPIALTRLRRDHEALIEQEGRRWVSSEEIYRVDTSFHETIAGFTGNPMFLQAIQQQNRLRRMLEYRGYDNRRRITDWSREHLAIIVALEQGDRVKASQLMHEHLDHARVTATRIAASDRKPPDGE